MTEADRIFSRFPEFIREYIFTHRWESLRGVQVAAARTLFLTDHHLLLTSSTASGKTEAAFFPILSDLCENPPMSVGALYICPLKSLINDQFMRISELAEEAGIPVYHWHGDVAQSHKSKLLKKPSGIRRAFKIQLFVILWIELFEDRIVLSHLFALYGLFPDVNESKKPTLTGIRTETDNFCFTLARDVLAEKLKILAVGHHMLRAEAEHRAYLLARHSLTERVKMHRNRAAKKHLKGVYIP